MNELMICCTATMICCWIDCVSSAERDESLQELDHAFVGALEVGVDGQTNRQTNS